MVEEIDMLQQKLNDRTDKLNSLKMRRDELARTLDETETHLKQVNPLNANIFILFIEFFVVDYDHSIFMSDFFIWKFNGNISNFIIVAGQFRRCFELHQARVQFKSDQSEYHINKTQFVMLKPN